MKMIRAAGSSRGFDFVMLAAAIVLGSVGAWILRQPVVIENNNLWMWLFFVGVCILGGLAMLRMDAWLPEASALPVPAARGSLIWRRRGRLCLIIAAILSAWVVIRLWPDYHQWDGTVLPWLISLGLVLAGAHLMGMSMVQGKQKPQQPAQALPKPDFSLPRWVEVTGFILIAALAVFLRVYRLDVFPPGIYVDETNSGLDALYILEGNGVSPFATGWYETPNGYIYFMAGMFRLFGANWYTLKAISILPAVLTVLAVYPLGRMMFGSLAGLAAMMFTAVSRWHLSMSRFGWNETAVPLFQILATYFLLRGLRERRPRDFAIGGMISGLMLYVYLSSRLALATIGLFLIYWILADPEGPRKSLRRNLPGILLFSFALLIAVAPLAVTYITNPFVFSNRVSEISILGDIKEAGSLEPLLLNIQDHLRFFHQVGDHQGKHNLPDEPEADPVTGALFAIGLVYAALRLRDRRRGLLWLWLLLGMAGGVLSSNHESPQSYRTLTALPAVTLLAGDVLSRMLRASRRVFPRGTIDRSKNRARTAVKTAGIVLFALCLAAAAVWESSVFINRQMTSPRVRAWFNPVEFAVGNEVVDALKAGQTIYLSPNFYNYSPMRFLVYGYMKPATGINTLDDHPYRLVRPEVTLPITDLSQDAVFLLDMWYQPVMEYFHIFYPNAQIDTVQPEGYDPLYLRVTVPLSDLAARQGLFYIATLTDGREVKGDSKGLTMPAEVKGQTVVEWHGSLRIERSGVYNFFGTDEIQLSLDDQPWSGSRFLCSGLHPVAVRWNAANSSELPQLRWAIDEESATAIPDQNWFRMDPIDQGLTGYYYRGADWEGEPVCSRPTPFFMLSWLDEDPIPGAFSAVFKGILRVPETGEYRLVINADDGARLTLDGVVVGESMTPEHNNDIDVKVALSSGDHPIQIDYYQLGGGSTLTFKWQPPGQPLSLVPMDALYPEP